MKKIFIKIIKLLGYEIIDQNNFVSPTLGKNLGEDLSSINKKSIVLPLGEVKITKKINSVLIIFRTNTDVEIWDQNKKRLFEEPKIEYSLRAFNSLVKSINFCKMKYPNIKFKTIIVDDKSNEENLNKIKKIIDRSDLDVGITSLDLSSTTMVLNFMFGYLVLEKLIDLISDFKALIEYSIFGSSNNLFLF